MRLVRMAGEVSLMELKKVVTSAEREYKESLFNYYNTSSKGLTSEEAQERLEKYGTNEIGGEKKYSLVLKLLGNVKNPLVILLSVLSLVSYLTGDIRGAIVMLIMVFLGVFLQFVQEAKADKSAEELKSMVTTTATVIRDCKQVEIPLKFIVPGDIVHLSSGDMIPADVQLISSKDLFVNQASLTGESLPVEKYVSNKNLNIKNPLDDPELCFMGSNVESGTAIALVLKTGRKTCFGALSSKLTDSRPMTSFDKGVNKFTWLMIRMIFVLAPIVFAINFVTKNSAWDAFLYAISIAVGLTPEMLPMIVTVNLSKGAVSMAKKNVIVKKLNAIQNFGAMDVLCTDKTGTITCGKVVVEKHIDINGSNDDNVLRYAYFNSFYQTGLKNMMDAAIIEYTKKNNIDVSGNYVKIDEIPFDFVRKRMSVVVRNDKKDVLICKGAVEEIVDLCSSYEISGITYILSNQDKEKITKLVNDMNSQGFRVIAVARKVFNDLSDQYSAGDECDLMLSGFMAFMDPPKETSKEAIKRFREHNVGIKILTGDSDAVSRKICSEIELDADGVLLGSDIDAMSDEELSRASENTTIFAKLSPLHKERVIKALKSKGHVVGFMGDGINDAPALKAADVGISVDSAVDIAKESSDIILLENNLLVLDEGIMEGRKVFANIVKYIKMTASSNFGNMFSVIGASIFVPFLPMMPIQVLTNNLLYDISQTAIPTDNVDSEWLEKPRKWEIGRIKKFILCIGPVSSIFDYATFVIMLFIFHAWKNPSLFQTGWFIESLFTQTLIVHVIRTNKVPFVQSMASRPLMMTSLAIMAAGVVLINSPLAGAFGFVKLPNVYWGFLAAILLCYIVLTQIIKTWFVKKNAY